MAIFWDWHCFLMQLFLWVVNMMTDQWVWPEGIALRPSVVADYPFLEALYASARAAEMAHTGWAAVEIAYFLKMQSQFQHQYYLSHYPNAHFDVIVWQGQDVGRLYWEWRANALGLMDIVLLPEYRNQGLGSILLQSLMRAAESRGKAIELCVEHYNPVQALYARLGFSEVRQNGSYRQLQWRPAALAVS